ncbi:MAG: hypothetical protein HY908_37525 [Myxococcales bacterium]|nr:hypothetical protein [Myxococcales bacterium]
MAAALAGCSTDPSAGSVGGACVDGACDTGLTCLSDLCVDASSLEPPPPAEVELAKIVSLAVKDNQDNVATSFAQHHPVTVHLWLLPEHGNHQHTIQVGLIEALEPGQDESTQHTCQLGSFEVELLASDQAVPAPVEFSHKFIIPNDCLREGDAVQTFNVWVAIDPTHAEEGDHAGIPESSHNTQFFDVNLTDTEGENRNAECYLDLAGQTGQGCIVDLEVHASPGLDVEFEEFELETEIGVVPRQGSYACDDGVSLTEADCLAAGQLWQLATELCDTDHGAPVLEVDGSFTLFGAEAHDGVTEGPVQPDVLDTFGPDAKLRIFYDFCPAEKVGDAYDCVAGESYVPLLLASTEHADFVCSNPAYTTQADCESHAGTWGPQQAPLVPSDDFADLPAGEPHHFHHKIFVEDGTAACSAYLGGWRDYGLFNLRVCAVPEGFTEDSHHGDHDANNCIVKQVQLIPGSFPEQGASNLEMVKDWGTSTGNDVVSANLALGTQNYLNLSGASTNNYAVANVGGWFSFPVVNLWAKANANVSIVGSGYDAGVEVFGVKLWGVADEVPSYHQTWNVSFQREYCMTYNYGVAGLGLNVKLCAGGSAGIDAEATINAATGAGNPPFDQSTKIGQATLTVTPYAQITAQASAYADLAALKGGATGDITLVSLRVPAVGDLKWGLVSGPSLVVTGAASLDLSLTLLQGSINVWVKAWQPSMCGWWPCSDWADVFNKNIAEWAGLNYSYNLFSQNAQLTLF